MKNEGLYKTLAEIINRDDPHIVGMPQTPAFVKLLSLQFTPEEAKLAMEVGLLQAGLWTSSWQKPAETGKPSRKC